MADQRRVAVLNWKDPWHPDAGGAEAYAWNVSRHLAGAGTRITFVTARPPGQPKTEVRDGITIVRAGGRWTVYIWALLYLLRRRRSFDAVIDCQSGVPFLSPLVVRRATPVVCVVHHVHDKQFDLHFGGLVARVGKWLEGPVGRRVYRGGVTVAVSPSTVAAMRARLRWTAPIVVVPNGLNHRDPAGKFPRSATPALVSVGRLAVHKRADRLLDIVDKLRDRWPGLRLDIVGDGPALPALRELIRERDLDANVVAHGYLDPPERDRVLRQAWLHLSASMGEGWGLVVLEAAEAGVPTLAYRVEGLQDAVRDGETGWLVEPGGELSAAADWALTSLDDPVCAKRIAAACRSWATGFDWQRTGERFAAVLDAVLASGPQSFGPADVVAVIEAADPRAVAAQAAPLLPRPHTVAVTAGRVSFFVPASSESDVRAALAAARLPSEAVVVRAASADESLAGAPG